MYNNYYLKINIYIIFSLYRNTTIKINLKMTVLISVRFIINLKFALIKYAFI